MSVRTTAKLAVLSATVVLAGTAHVAPTGAASSKVSFGTPVKVSANSTGQSAAEPSIRSARDGTLYIVAPPVSEAFAFARTTTAAATSSGGPTTGAVPGSSSVPMTTLRAAETPISRRTVGGACGAPI